MGHSTAALQELWRRVYRDKKSITMEHATVADARRQRLALYRAVKDARKETGLVDEELKKAADNVALSIKGTTLTLRFWADDPFMQQVLDIIGEVPKEAKEIAADASAANVLKKLEELGGSDRVRAADRLYPTKSRGNDERD